MKYFTTLFAILFAINLNAQYTLWWADEFNGTSLNTNDWNVERGGGSAWNNTAVDDPRVVEVSNGTLKLKGIKNPNYSGDIANVSSIDKNSVWTGAVDTHRKVGFRYGKMEVRARIESAPRAWPAIWLMPVDSRYGGNPLSGEIDIVEHLNYDNFYYSTVHTEYHLTNKNDPERYGEGLFTNDDNEWVVYGMEWTDQKIDFLRNGQVYHTVNKGSGLYVNGLLRWPFDEDFYIILSQQIGGGWVDGEASAKGLVMRDSDLPLTMEIDYVRVYQKSANTIDYDLTASGITRSDNNSCGTTFDIDVDVTNMGAQTITSFDVDVYVDNQLVKSESKNANLTNTASTTISVTGISAATAGTKNVKVVVSNPNGNTDEVPSNDETTASVLLSEGNPYEFFITKEVANSNIEWEIKDGNTTIASSASITAVTSGNNLVQSFCMPDGCYELVVSNAFKTVGSCSSNEWQSGVQYCKGEQVSRSGNLYEAKWCGTTDPNSNGQFGMWEDLGACAPAANGTYGISGNGATYLTIKEENFTSSLTSDLAITNGKVAPTVTIELSNQSYPVCLDTIATYTATTTGDVSAAIEWYVDGNKEGEGASIDIQNIDGQTIEARLPSNLVCTNNGIAQSNELTALVIDCTVGMFTIEDFNFEVYPNPVVDEVIIEGKAIKSIEILDVTGKIVSQHNVKGNMTTLNTSDLAGGVYFLKIYSRKGVVVNEIQKR